MGQTKEILKNEYLSDFNYFRWNFVDKAENGGYMKLLLSLLFLASCAATMNTAPTVSAYAPKGYKGRGQMKYLNSGASFIVNSRRENAFKQMHEACGGDYSILGEGNRPDGSIVSPNGFGGLNINQASEYVYIDFQCEGERVPASK